MMFTPKRNDGRPVWRVIYDEIVRRIDANELSVGDVIPHDSIRTLLTERELSGYYSAVGRASTEMARKLARTLRPSRNAGYVLTAGMAQVEFGRAHKKRGVRSIKRGLSLVKTTDRSLMSLNDNRATDMILNGLTTLAGIASMHEERLAEIDNSIQDLRSAQMRSKHHQTATSDEVSELRRRIEMIESKSRPLVSDEA